METGGIVYGETISTWLVARQQTHHFDSAILENMSLKMMLKQVEMTSKLCGQNKKIIVYLVIMCKKSLKYD